MALVNYKCPNCGGGLKFDPATQSFECEYCLSSFTEQEMEELAKKAEEKAGASPAVVCTCPNCGAELVAEETTAAAFCYYCHSPVIVSGRLSGEFLPDYVIPFALDRKRALEIFSGWIGKKKFLPRAFFSESQIEKFTGVYFPYLMYSCQAEGKMTAEAEKLRIWTAGNIRYTEHKKYQVERAGELDVKNMARNALSRADHELVEGVLPFDMEKLEPFRMEYLSGFQAEKRDMDSHTYTNEVEAKVRAYAEENLRGSMGGYDSVRVKDQSVEIRNASWKYALLPVWVMTYRDRKKDKLYYFAMNGQTGKINGELPVDKGKLAALFGAVFVPVFLFLLAGGWLI